VIPPLWPKLALGSHSRHRAGKQRGGILGKKIKLITEDDQSNQDQANAVQKLISRDKVTAILGEVASSRSLAGGSVARNPKPLPPRPARTRSPKPAITSSASLHG
jgi:branched-chain amino acid transport system substrate-binding protein